MADLIERWQEAKRIAEGVRRHYTHAAGLDSPQNDKHRIECSFIGMSQNRFHPVDLRFEAIHGYYGDSSGYSDMDEATGRYVAKAITEMGKAIMRRAAELAEADAEAARVAAVDEAQAVLATTQAVAS